MCVFLEKGVLGFGSSLQGSSAGLTACAIRHTTTPWPTHHSIGTPRLQYSRLVEGHEEEEEGGAHDHNHQQQQAAPNLGDEILKALSAGADAYGASAAAPAGPHVPRHYPAVPRPEAPGTGARYAKGRGVGAAQGPPQLPAWMSDQMVQSLTSVLLELPFSRRAETEADLIGEGRIT